jgi:hypothetical protein
MALAALNLLSGTLIISINGSPITTASINLSGATSFSNAADLIQTALQAQLASTTCTFNSTLNAFVISSPTTGAPGSAIGFATGTLAVGIKLTSATGAVTSQGANAAVPATALNAISDATQNWASFFTVFEPVLATKLLFAEWVQTTNERYTYVAWDSDAQIIAGADPDTFGAQCVAAEFDGIAPIYDTTGDIAAFLAGAIASIDFEATAGRITFAGKGQAGLTPDITNLSAATAAEANGYNYYAAFATANDRFVNFQRGSTPGKWEWLDSYVNQIWLNNEFQLVLMVAITTYNSIPYTQAGYNILRAVLFDPINTALNSGVIQPGVTLSNSQRAAINTAVGSPNAAGVVETQGWYLDIKNASPEQRALRASPPMTFYYTDGGSIQQIELSSIEVQ